MINRGSEWRKWDLHVHTPLSIKQQYGNTEIGWEKFISALENLPHEVKVIGITDYYFIDGYEKVMQFKKNGRLNNIEKIFPILEFRIDTFGTASENDLQKINLHILFNVNENDLEKEIQKIKSEFIGQIPITKLEKHSTKMLSLNNLTVEGNNSLDIGFANLIPATDLVFKKIKSDTWKDKTILFLGYKEWSNLEKNQQLRPFKEDLYSKVDAFFSNGFETNSKNQNWLNEYGNKRLLHSLDIHGFDLLDTYEIDSNGSKKSIVNYKCNTWIKSQPTFEGLRQIIYEPDERVKIQKEKPESEKLDNLMIEKVTFTSSNNRFTSEQIYFNKNLNVIIGGKSSGKSILLYKIAKTLYGSQNNSVLKYKDADDNFIEKDLYNLSFDDSYFDFNVETYLATNQSIKRGNQTSILPSIKYIPQNHLSDLVDKSKRNSKELKKYIRNLILEDPKYHKIYNDFVDNLKTNDGIRKNDITEYFTYKEELEKKDNELKQKGDKESIKKTIEGFEKKILETNKELTTEQSNDYNNLSEKKSELEKNKNSLLNDLEKLQNFSEILAYSLSELNAKKNLLFQNIELQEIKNEFETKFKFIEDAISENNNIKKLFSKDENDIFESIDNNIFSIKLNTINLELHNLEEKLLPYINQFENQKLVINYQKSISEEKIKLSEIEQIEKEIENIRETAKKRKEKIFQDIRSNRNLYDKLLIDLLPRIKKIKEEDSELNIEGKIYFDFPEYRGIVLDLSHGNSKSYNNFQIFNDDKKSISEYNFEGHIEDLKSIFKSIENKDYKLLNNIKQSEAIIKILGQKYFFDHWDITYKNDTIHKMSTGKASLVLLKVMIKLSSVKGPILIDQPEDNLDNRSVTNELIEYLKEKKKERQIILVTHNANIVVNADAENIIIANQKGQSEDDKLGSEYLFDYINGAIEDIKPISVKNDEKDLLKSMGIREHITQIVEGGKEAFKKREEKYGF
jgi:hypothetical protein